MMNLSHRHVLELHQAIGAIDGSVSDGDKRKPLPFKVAYACARTLAALKPIHESFHKAKSAAIAKYSNGQAGLADTDVNFQACQAEITELLDMQIPIEPHLISASELELCGLSPSTLSALMPILKD